MKQTLDTPRFGTLEYDSQEVYYFEEGLLGFTQCQQFLLVQHNENTPFRWLQSIDDPQLAWPLLPPTSYVPNYKIVLPKKQAEKLKLELNQDFWVYTIANIPAKQPHKLTINLLGPIILNEKQKLGRQIVLENEGYSVKHPIFSQQSSNDNVGSAA